MSPSIEELAAEFPPCRVHGVRGCELCEERAAELQALEEPGKYEVTLPKRDFVISLREFSGGPTFSTRHAFDPCDIYDAALASVVRKLARDLTGERLEGVEDVAHREHQAPSGVWTRPTASEQDPVYRQEMRDAGRGHLLP